jgi:hypothetical protein
MPRKKPPNHGRPKKPNIPGRRTVNRSRTSPRAVIKALRINEALKLRLQGYTLTQIGEELHRDPADVHRDIMEGLEKLPRDNAEKLRDMELQRLDMMAAAIFPEAVGDALESQIQALDAMLKIMRQRARYVAVELPKPESHGPGYGGGTAGGAQPIHVTGGLPDDEPPAAEPQKPVADGGEVV